MAMRCRDRVDAMARTIEKTDLMIGVALGGATAALLWALSGRKKAAAVQTAPGAAGDSTGVPPMDPFEEAPAPESDGGDDVTPINQQESTKFEAAVLASAKRDLGVRETSENSGPRVDEMLRAVGVQPPDQWCSAAVSAWIRGASRATARTAPLVGSANPNDLIKQFQAAQDGSVGWIDAAQIRENPNLLRPGMIVFWRAYVGRPAAGHVGVFERNIDATAFGSIEGNSGINSDSVARGKRFYASDKLLGAGWFADKSTPLPA